MQVFRSFFAAATGGLVPDTNENIFLVHLYAWISLFGIPFAILMVHPSLSLWGQLAYCIAAVAVFALIQHVNLSLHSMFDSTAPQTDVLEPSPTEQERMTITIEPSSNTLIGETSLSEPPVAPPLPSLSPSLPLPPLPLHPIEDRPEQPVPLRTFLLEDSRSESARRVQFEISPPPIYEEIDLPSLRLQSTSTHRPPDIELTTFPHSAPQDAHVDPNLDEALPNPNKNTTTQLPEHPSDKELHDLSSNLDPDFVPQSNVHPLSDELVPSLNSSPPQVDSLEGSDPSSNHLSPSDVSNSPLLLTIHKPEPEKNEEVLENSDKMKSSSQPTLVHSEGSTSPPPPLNHTSDPSLHDSISSSIDYPSQLLSSTRSDNIFPSDQELGVLSESLIVSISPDERRPLSSECDVRTPSSSPREIKKRSTSVPEVYIHEGDPAPPPSQLFLTSSTERTNTAPDTDPDFEVATQSSYLFKSWFHYFSTRPRSIILLNAILTQYMLGRDIFNMASPKPHNILDGEGVGLMSSSSSRDPLIDAPFDHSNRNLLQETTSSDLLASSDQPSLVRFSSSLPTSSLPSSNDFSFGPNTRMSKSSIDRVSGENEALLTIPDSTSASQKILTLSDLVLDVQTESHTDEPLPPINLPALLILKDVDESYNETSTDPVTQPLESQSALDESSTSALCPPDYDAGHPSLLELCAPPNNINVNEAKKRELTIPQIEIQPPSDEGSNVSSSTTTAPVILPSASADPLIPHERLRSVSGTNGVFLVYPSRSPRIYWLSFLFEGLVYHQKIFKKEYGVVLDSPVPPDSMPLSFTTLTYLVEYYLKHTFYFTIDGNQVEILLHEANFASVAPQELRSITTLSSSGAHLRMSAHSPPPSPPPPPSTSAPSLPAEDGQPPSPRRYPHTDPDYAAERPRRRPQHRRLGRGRSARRLPPTVVPIISGEHHHPLSDASVLRSGWRCDRCLEEFRGAPAEPFSIPHPTRYRCIRLCDFDLCYTCMEETKLPIELQPLPFRAQTNRTPSRDSLDVPPADPLYVNLGNDSRILSRPLPPLPPVRARSEYQSIDDPDGVYQEDLPRYSDPDPVEYDVPYHHRRPRHRISRRTILLEDEERGALPTVRPRGIARPDRANTNRNGLADPNDNTIYSAEGSAPKIFYPFHYFGVLRSNIYFDRQYLLTFLDRNKTFFDFLGSSSLFFLTAFLAFQITQFYNDMTLAVLWIVVATCQFSLLKSPQPDANSSSLDERKAAYSRSLYFCFISSIVLACDYSLHHFSETSLRVYNIPLHVAFIVRWIRDVLTTVILFFPLIFMSGLLPNWRTFFHFTLEQFDLHLFGGFGCFSLKGAIVQMSKNLTALFFCGLSCHFAIKNSPDTPEENGIFSIYCACIISFGYLSSCFPSGLAVKCSSCAASNNVGDATSELLNSSTSSKAHERSASLRDKPLLAENLVLTPIRFIANFLLAALLFCIAFSVHVTGLFPRDDDRAQLIIGGVTVVLGVFLHYFLSQLRAPYPWRFLSAPVITPSVDEYTVKPNSKFWYELLYFWGNFTEKYICYPFLILAMESYCFPILRAKFGSYGALAISAVCGIKLSRQAFSDRTLLYPSLLLSIFLFEYDFRNFSESLLLDFTILTVLVSKFEEVFLKISFWSTMRAFANLREFLITGFATSSFIFTIPLYLFFFGCAFFSSLISAPMYPVVGSLVFGVSYFRPIKFWEKTYETKVLDESQASLSSPLSRRSYDPGLNANNLNAIFYLHLLEYLKKSLCNDIEFGRFGNVAAGDFLVLVDSDNRMTILLHIIERGNGYVGFQFRGLEFAGTFCQAREIEAMDTEVAGIDGVMFHRRKGPTSPLSLKNIFGLRYQTWQQVNTKYLVDGYNISLLQMSSTFALYESRSLLLKFLTQSIVYHLVHSPKLHDYLSNDALKLKLASFSVDYSDKDACFSRAVDLDWDPHKRAVLLQKFFDVYREWLLHCLQSCQFFPDLDPAEVTSQHLVLKLSFALSTFARRFIHKISRSMHNASSNPFYAGFYHLFHGTVEVTDPKDRWLVESQVSDLIDEILVPAARMALRLHQDHLTDPNEYDDLDSLYTNVSDYLSEGPFRVVICNETDPLWRRSILRNSPALLTLRHNIDDSSFNGEYFVIRLTKGPRTFKVVSVNRESVRGFWAGQQQEVLYFKNTYNERGSIQNSKCCLRNILNQSGDQPLGYPSFVSELTVSYSSFPDLSLTCREVWNRMRAWWSTRFQSSH